MDERLDAYRLLIADVFELAGTSRATSEKLAADVGRTAARWHVLSVVSDEPHPIPAIARRLGLARRSVRRVVGDLVDEGLVIMEPNPAHSRRRWWPPQTMAGGLSRSCSLDRELPGWPSSSVPTSRLTNWRRPVAWSGR